MKIENKVMAETFYRDNHAKKETFFEEIKKLKKLNNLFNKSSFV
ncbi:hypothetical protein CAR_c23250 [Carnobacterium sp. 17-4]|nr:hypothetical protein CAR_c23250 [Carnobacterium sp. 17-4]